VFRPAAPDDHSVLIGHASGLALSADTTLVIWDGDLRRAATLSGCPVAPPGCYVL